VNTVSPTYAKEITKADDLSANFLGGRGLEGDLLLRKKEGRLEGILNGLDYTLYSPSLLDPAFEASSPDLLSLRRQHRDKLWSEFPALIASLTAKHGTRFGNASRVAAHLDRFLAAAATLPLTVCVTRAVSQKLGLFTEDYPTGVPLARSFLAQGTALLVLGTGELEDRLEQLNDEPTALFLQVFDADLATRLYAVGELFLMPSDFEPCGISQLMSLRYGCLPLVHDRGGLHDTVRDGETGFVFQGKDRLSAKKAFLKTTAQAVTTVNGPGYENLVRTAMGERFTWEKALDLYINLYRKIFS
jgi:starch synthase